MAAYSQEDFFNQLQFNYPTYKRGGVAKRNGDVTVRIYHNDTRADRVTITFYNDTAKKVFKSGFGLVARWKNRMVFKDDESGFMLSKNELKNGESYRIQYALKENEIPSHNAFIGDYDLRYDDLYEYYYIERKETNA